MKKLLCMLIVLVLILPSFSFADDPDPIIGSWYLFMDIKGSIFESSLPNVSKLYCVITFEESGKLLYCEFSYNGEKGEANTPAVMGEWKNNGSDYTVSFLFTGTETAYIKNDMLYLAILSPGVHFGFNRMHPIDFYSDVEVDKQS